MKNGMDIQEIEDQLRHRQMGWWIRLERSIPELCEMSNTQQSPEYHAEGDVAKHTRLAIEACPDSCDPDLLWAALLHDIGKPATTLSIEGKITAHGHGRVGAVIADGVLDRLGMPQKRKDRIVWAVKHHLFHHSWQLKNIQDATRKQISFVKHADFPLLLELLRVDSVASEGHSRKLTDYEFYRQLKLSVSCKA
jgi:putative nucleotidyltransferase with HDIG domain